MSAAYLVGAVRTAIGKFGGALASVPAPVLGACAAREALQRARVSPDQVQETIIGCARQAGVGPNPGRQVSHLAGIPDSVPAYTVNQACASGMKSIILGAQALQADEAEVVLAGGTENMSRVPYLLTSARFGQRMGHADLTDAMFRDGFICPLCDRIMGETAETLASEYRISREEQDRYAAESQRRCKQAVENGLFQQEIVPVEINDRQGRKQVFCTDEHPRPGVTSQSLAKLSPVFDRNGTITAGSSSGITDGAAAVLVCADPLPSATGPRVRVRGWASVGVDPRRMGIGPVPAIRTLLERTALNLDDIEVVEINEAFAAQILACQRELGIDPSRLNPRGGAIALGHPIGCSGIRIVVTLIHEMVRRDARFGLAALCVSGGMGMAMLLESV